MSQARICRAVKRLSHSRTTDPEEQAAERDEFLRLLWGVEIGRVDPGRLVFVDTRWAPKPPWLPPTPTRP